MGLFEWGEKRFARGIAKAMIRSYRLYNEHYPNLDELALIKRVLSDRPGEPAKDILINIDIEDFWKNVAGASFAEVIYILVRMEYIERMRGTLEKENPETNKVFKKIITEEIKNAGLRYNDSISYN